MAPSAIYGGQGGTAGVTVRAPAAALKQIACVNRQPALALARGGEDGAGALLILALPQSCPRLPLEQGLSRVLADSWPRPQ